MIPHEARLVIAGLIVFGVAADIASAAFVEESFVNGVLNRLYIMAFGIALGIVVAFMWLA